MRDKVPPSVSEGEAGGYLALPAWARIVMALLDGDATLTGLARRAGVGWASLYRNIELLEALGLVEKKRGRKTVVSLTETGREVAEALAKCMKTGVLARLVSHN